MVPGGERERAVGAAPPLLLALHPEGDARDRARTRPGREQVERYWRIEPDRFLLLGHPTPEFALEAGAEPLPPRDALDRRGIGERYLLYPAQFWAHKNHAHAVRRARRCSRTSSSCSSAPTRASSSTIARLARELGVGDRVHFLGFVPTDELVALYRHAHALTYLSLFGPENLPPLEAMALGCPVVAADVPGRPRAARRRGAARAAARPGGRRGRRARASAIRSSASGSWPPGASAAARFTAEGYVGGVLEFLDEFERIRRGWHERDRHGVGSAVGHGRRRRPSRRRRCGTSSTRLRLQLGGVGEPRACAALRPTRDRATPSSRSSPSSARTGSSSSSSSAVPIENDVFVEFGVEDYTRVQHALPARARQLARAGDRRRRTPHERFLRATGLGWRHHIDAVTAFIDRDNINRLIRGAGIEGDIGLLSVDIDGNDFWVLEADRRRVAADPGRRVQQRPSGPRRPSRCPTTRRSCAARSTRRTSTGAPRWRRFARAARREGLRARRRQPRRQQRVLRAARRARRASPSSTSPTRGARAASASRATPDGELTYVSDRRSGCG